MIYYSILSWVSGLGKWFSGGIQHMAGGAKHIAEGAVLQIIEYFIQQFIDYIFSFITMLLMNMVNMFFNFVYSFQGATNGLGPVGFSVFIIGFAFIGGILYLVFRLIEGLL